MQASKNSQITKLINKKIQASKNKSHSYKLLKLITNNTLLRMIINYVHCLLRQMCYQLSKY